MRNTITKGVVAAALMGLAQPVLADSAETKGGLKVKTDDGRFEFALNGRIHYDVYSIDADDCAGCASPAQDAAGGSFFRRTRITLSGKAYGWDYKFEEDFTGSGPSGYREMWIATDLGPGKLHIGEVKPPRTMEELTSSNEITFMERPFASSVGIWGGGRQHQMGLFYLGSAGMVGYGASIYNLAEQVAGAGVTEGVGTTERFYIAPIMGDGLNLHLGLSGTMENFHNNRTGGPGSPKYTGRVGPSLAMGTTAANRETQTVQAEVGFGAGQFTFQTEYARMTLEQATGTPDQDVVTYYAQASVFLTGESKPYDLKKGVFKSPKPKGAAGAWELAARYDTIKNDDAALQPEIALIIAGLNWYVNPNVRFMLDYWMPTAETTTAGVTTSDEPTAVSLRAQLAF